jgi:hypothetical protein
MMLRRMLRMMPRVMPRVMVITCHLEMGEDRRLGKSSLSLGLGANGFNPPKGPR